ncbi:MAG: penicillin-binding protein [bacterium]
MRVTKNQFDKATERQRAINTLYRNRKSREFYKFAMLKKIFGESKGDSKKLGKRKPRNPYIILLKRIAIVASFVFLLAILSGCIVAASYVAEVSKSLTTYNPNDPFSAISNIGDSIIYSSDNVELKRISGNESREFIKIEDVPDYVRAAFVAAEDKTFFQNKGVDPLGVVRAFINTVIKKEGTQGGSTITQQVVKVNMVGDKQNIERKVKEMILSVQITKKFSKNEILQLYINSIPFGGTITGIKRAAKVYFNKDVKDLTYAEAALLAGIPQSPSTFAPTLENDPSNQQKQPDGTMIPLNRIREKYVLDNMYEIADTLNKDQGYKLDQQKIKEAKDETITYNFAKNESKAPHFVQVVNQELKKLLKAKYPEKTDSDIDGMINSGGLRVYTTLDWEMQAKAEEDTSKIDNTTDKWPGFNKTLWDLFGAKNAALISVSPKTGGVYAYVGSAGFDRNEGELINGQVDIIQSGVHMGSSMKVANYMNAFIQKGAGPESTVANINGLKIYPDYAPKNYSVVNRQTPSMPIREALNQSLNIPATQSMLIGGVDNYAELVGKMGYTDAEVARVKEMGVQSTLGSPEITPWSHAQLFQVVANGGVRKDLYTINKITDKDGNLIFQKTDDPGVRVVDEKYTYLMYDILKDYTTLSYVNNGRREGVRPFGYDCAGKTGTYAADDSISGSSSQIVFWGFCPDLVTGMWAGNNTLKVSLNKYAVGENLGQTLWTDYMKSVLPKFPKNKFVRPAGVVTASICIDTGLIATNETQCEKGSGLFAQGNLPKVDDNHKKLRVTDCNGTLKLAGPADELAGKAYDKEFVKYETLTGSALIQKQIDAYVVEKMGLPLEPTETCNDPRTADGSILTKITSPANGTQFSAGDTIQLTSSTIGTNGSIKYTFYTSFITEVKTSPYTASYLIPAGTLPGTYAIKAVYTDASGKTGQDIINVIVKAAYDITITAPVNNASIAHSKVHIATTITDPNNQVTTVKFFASKNGGATYQIGSTITKSGNTPFFDWDLTTVTSVGTYVVYAEVYTSAAGANPVQSSKITFFIT